MSKIYNRENLIAKINWQGGIESALDYGIKSGDMPDEDLQVAWSEMENAWVKFAVFRDAIDDMLEGEPGW